VDISKRKIEKMKVDYKRFKYSNIKIVVDDATNLKRVGEIPYDKIFIDAPCSALGTIAKNPDVKYSKQQKDLDRLASNSLSILEGCDHHLRPGGKITYYTCTLSPVENQQVIEVFLRKNPHYSIVKTISKELEYPRSGGCMEIKPYFFGSEGGFACTLVKGS
jgi:16S rRNA (cytosine967-C5)-methyltransferase